MTRKCLYCGVTYSVKAYSKCPFKCPWLGGAAGLYGNLQGLNSVGLTAGGFVSASQLLQQQAMTADRKEQEVSHENKPVTPAAHYHFSKALQKDLLDLHAQVIALQDSHNALRNQVQRMDTRDEPAFIKLLSGLPLTPSPSPSKTRINKGRKRGKNK